jgi:putative oxygen-independent coproporphyrinogen III oxidase
MTNSNTAGHTAHVMLDPARLRLTTPPPLSLYIHFPWCIKKCPYCDFNSHTVDTAGTFPENDYLTALRTDLEYALPLIWGRRVQTVFIGGGTPSLMSAAGIDRLLTDVRTLLPLAYDAEITLEANPGAFEAEKFSQFRASGVNRLSIGIQSFNDASLKALGRIHDGQAAHHAAQIAQQSFDNFNLDLMFALPGQTLEASRADLEAALTYDPPHLSLYQLTLEANTYFAKYPPRLPNDDDAAEMQDWIGTRLCTAHHTQYEVSAYAQPHRQCRHNLNYWQFGDYLGIGAGAHSKLSFAQRIIRQIRYKHPATYLTHCQQNNPVQHEQIVGIDDIPFEFMLNALRLSNGFPTSYFTARTGLPITHIRTALDEAETRGLLVHDHKKIAPTALGQRFLNDLQMLFLKKKRVSQASI